MKLANINPFLRVAMIQPAVLEGGTLRMAYDHRFFYILEGEGWLILPEEKLPLVPDDLIFLQPQQGYYFKGRMRVLVLNFDLTRGAEGRKQPIAPPPQAEYDPALLFEAGDEAFPSYRLFHGQVRAPWMELVDGFRQGEDCADAVTSGLLKRLLAELFGSFGERETVVRRAERYIELHAATLRDNAALASVFGYHPVYLEALFKEATGKTLHQAVLERRLELARQLLLRTEYSIEEIAYDTGFSSRGHFCTVFKRHFGCSPLQYRNRTKR